MSEKSPTVDVPGLGPPAMKPGGRATLRMTTSGLMAAVAVLAANFEGARFLYLRDPAVLSSIAATAVVCQVLLARAYARGRVRSFDVGAIGAGSALMACWVSYLFVGRWAAVRLLEELMVPVRPVTAWAVHSLPAGLARRILEPESHAEAMLRVAFESLLRCPTQLAIGIACGLLVAGLNAMRRRLYQPREGVLASGSIPFGRSKGR